MGHSRVCFRRCSLFRMNRYCAVSENITCGLPSGIGPSACTCTVPAVPGKVKVTEATPDEFVTAITFEPVVVPLESDPALVVNKMLAPDALPPDCPAVNVTVSGRVVPTPPVWLSPLVFAKLAAGLPTTIHPLCVCVTVPSLPVTV